MAAGDKGVYEETYMQKVTTELKAAITEGHQLLKDMKAERKAFEQLFTDVRTQTRSSVESHITAQVKAGLAEYRASMERATDTATKAVMKRFDTLADILMGTDDPNKESLAMVVRKWKADGR
jgi:hypothetical protein